MLLIVSFLECVDCSVFVCYVFFFKQKTAYEVRISDWSSDVCSSDLKGATDPTVARMFSRSDSSSISRLIVLAMLVASRPRTPSRSVTLPATERRHSVIPAENTRATGRSDFAARE